MYLNLFNFFEIIEINVIIKNVNFWKGSNLSQKNHTKPIFHSAKTRHVVDQIFCFERPAALAT